MKIEDIEVGKWYWFIICGSAFSRLVVAKDEANVIARYSPDSHATVWKPAACIAEDIDKNKKEDKSWRTLWGLISR